MRDDDAFWAARRVAAFTDEMIRAVVHTGEYSDPDAEKYLADVLIKRRDKITRTWLTAVNPIISPRLDGSGRLTLENAAVAAGAASGPAAYRAAWFRFDNATGEVQPIAETRSTSTAMEAPSGLPATAGGFVGADVSVESEGYPSWRRPVRIVFRRDGGGWTLVGLERLPEQRPGNEPARPASR